MCSVFCLHLGKLRVFLGKLRLTSSVFHRAFLEFEARYFGY